MDTIGVNISTGINLSQETKLHPSSTTISEIYLYENKPIPILGWIDFTARNNFFDYLQDEIESESYQTMLASEEVLSRDWDNPGEDEAWAHL